MRLLLDTQALPWFLGGNRRLSAAARQAIEDLNNERLFSVAGMWAVAIKVSLSKLQLHVPFATLFPSQLEANAIELPPIRPAHAAEVLALPFHHRDPFDRMLVVQSRVESATVVSSDPGLDPYGIPRIW
ncbi:type II toxin-antitoxin system VapC family toxin [soil metagenome]